MRSVSVRLCDLHKAVIPLGFVGENEHTRVRFDCMKLFGEYPEAVQSLTVQPPMGVAYPAVTVRDGDYVIWDVTDSDLAEDGNGEIQLTFTVDGVVAKSYIAKTKISRSLEPAGDVPAPIDDWLTRANAALAEIPAAIEDAIDDTMGEITAEAETLEAGTAATAAFDPETKILSFGIPAGEQGEKGDDGNPGQDGYSPSASVSKSGSTATITITDKNGTTSATVSDGQPGQDGADGQPGADGFSPSASVSKTGNVSTITITDKDGTTTAEVLDGDAGKGGAPAIEKSASGAMVTFDDGADDYPVKSLIATIEPYQQGNNDPSPTNIRPISGLGAASIHVAGRNLLDLTVYNGGTYNPDVGDVFTLTKASDARQFVDNHDGTFTTAFTTTWGYRTVICPVKAGNTYYRYMKLLASGNKRVTYGTLDRDFRVLTKTNDTSTGDITISGTTSPTKACYVFFVITNGSSQNISVTIQNPIVVMGNALPQYVPHTGKDYSVSFGSTVYGGNVDAINGTLTVTHGMIASYDGETLPGVWMSDRDVYAEGTTPTTGAQVVYELAEPIVSEVEPIEPSTLLGENHIWADCGDVAVTYTTDTKTYVDSNEGVKDVQVNGTSVVTDGVANVPVHSIPSGGNAGQVLKKSSGTDYAVEWADADPVQNVSGTTPSITALAGVRYVCGEVSTLDITLPASGCIDVTFASGATATVLTITPPTGVTVRWANGFDPTSLDANTTYEVNICDGLGVAVSWT